VNLWVKSNNVTKPITWPFNSQWVTSYRWSIVTMRLSCTVTKIYRLKDNGVTIDFDLLGSRDVSGHVTILLGIYVISYWWSIVTMRLSCTVKEIWSFKLAFAYVKGQKFTAHASCHVTCRQGVQNNRIFGIPEATLPIHYATLVKLRWRLRVVCRWASPLLSISVVIFPSPKMGLKFSVLADLRGKIWKTDVDTPWEINPHRNTSFSAKNATILPKMCSPELGKKSKKRKKITQLNIIFHPFAPPTLLGRFVPFLARGIRPPT